MLMHGEVSADDMKELHCEEFEVTGGMMSGLVNYCKVKDLTCVLYRGRSIFFDASRFYQCSITRPHLNYFQWGSNTIIPVFYQ